MKAHTMSNRDQGSAEYAQVRTTPTGKRDPCRFSAGPRPPRRIHVTCTRPSFASQSAFVNEFQLYAKALPRAPYPHHDGKTRWSPSTPPKKRKRSEELNEGRGLLRLENTSKTNSAN